MSKTFLSLFILLFLVPVCALAQEAFNIEGTGTLDLSVNGKSKTVTVVAKNPSTFPDDQAITWTGQGSFVSISNGTLSSDKSKITFTLQGLKPTDGTNLTATLAAEATKTQSIAVKVFREVSAQTILIAKSTGSSGTIKLTGEDIKIPEGRSTALSIMQKDASQIPSNALTVSSDNAAIAFGALDQGLLTMRPISLGTTVIRLKAYDDEIASIKVSVVKPTSIQNRIEINKSATPEDLATKLGVPDTSILNFKTLPDPAIAELSADRKTIKGNLAKSTQFVVVVPETDETQTVEVVVRPKPGSIEVEGYDAGKSLIYGTPQTYKFAVLSDEGTSIPGADVLLTSSLPCLSATKIGRNTFTVKAETNVCPSVVLTYSTTVNGTSLSKTIQLGVSVVRGFSPLSIRLEVMDHQNAKDLFGPKTADEFIVANARLFNKVNIEETEGAAERFWNDPILVYSQSLEVKVAVQIKCDKQVNKNCTDNEWRDLHEDDPIVTEQFPTYNPNGSSPNSYVRKVNGNCRIDGSDYQKHFFFKVRPLVYEMVNTTQDSRSNRSTRSKVLKTLNAISTAASVVTAVAVPGPGSDITLGLDKFRNLLIPGIERVFPSMSEANRQNVGRWTMRELEEIAFGSDLTRVIFFPRGERRGMIPGHLVRVTDVSISNSCAEVALIQKVRNL
ncbi:MAG: hypothetical protein ABL952_02165 [Pyrinomonadaceae bacterium]